MSPVAQVVGAAAGGAVAGINIFKELYKYCFEPQCNMSNNFQELHEEHDDLGTEERDMSQNAGSTLTASRRRSLLYKVRKIKNKIEDIDREYEYSNSKKYLWGMCPFFKRRKLGICVVETKKEVTVLKNKFRELRSDQIAERRPAQAFEGPSEGRAGDGGQNELLQAVQDIVVLKKQTSDVQQLLEQLRDENVKRIRITGTNGSGKTTILKMLYTEAKKGGTFDTVILTCAWGNKTVKMIQEDIVRNLKLNLENINSQEQVARMISQTLEEKKYLLLIDQVSSTINLNDVGIRDNHMYGKIVFAFNQRIVPGIDAQEFRIEKLPDDDARTLFGTIVGHVKDLKDIKPLVDRILLQTGGMPRLIKAVASQLRGLVSVNAWENILRTLQRPVDGRQQHQEEQRIVFNLVYDTLKDPQKDCLLYAALFPKGHKVNIDYLVECWIIERYIKPKGRNRPFKLARDDGNDILRRFIESSLLDRGPSVNGINMPENFRKLALEILDEGNQGQHHLLVEEDETEPPRETDWMLAERISLMCDGLPQLPKKPNCPKVSALLIQKNSELQNIPKSFFAQMNNLQMLDLYQTGVKSLPPSVFTLARLKGLYLKGCHGLVVLSPKIAKLKNLEILDIRETGIRSLPREIGQLSNLKCLRFSFQCRNVTSNGSGWKYNILHYLQKLWKPRVIAIVPANSIKNLQRLEELTIIVDQREESWNRIVDDIAKEVRGLTNLSFKVLFGYHEAKHELCRSTERFLGFCGGNDVPPEIGKVLRQATAFELVCHQNVCSLSQFRITDMNCLQVCVIEECNQMISIVDTTDEVCAADAVFPRLEELHILNLPKLDCIWRGQLVGGCLAKLQTITLKCCPSLTKILSCGTVQQLCQLKRLIVEDCCKVQKIIEIDTDNLSDALPKLEMLQLIGLPSLLSICTSPIKKWCCLDSIKIEKCTSLCDLSLSTTNAQALHSISCNKDWWEALKLEDGLRRHLEPLCQFLAEEDVESVNGRLPDEASSSSQAIIHSNQPSDSNENVYHAVENIMNGHASSSNISAGVCPPTDPSPSSQFSKNTGASQVVLTSPNPQIHVSNGPSVNLQPLIGASQAKCPTS